METKNFSLGNLVIYSGYYSTIIQINEHEVSLLEIKEKGVCNCVKTKDLTLIKITEDWMQKFKQIRKIAKNNWYISLAHLKSEIHIELFKGCFVFSIQNDMGIFWLPNYRFIHEIQNLCKSLNAELSLADA